MRGRATWPECGSILGGFLFSAHADGERPRGWTESGGRRRKGPRRGAPLGPPSDRHASSAFAVGTLRDIKKKKTRSAMREPKPVAAVSDSDNTIRRSCTYFRKLCGACRRRTAEGPRRVQGRHRKGLDKARRYTTVQIGERPRRFAVGMLRDLSFLQKVL